MARNFVIFSSLVSFFFSSYGTVMCQNVTKCVLVVDDHDNNNMVLLLLQMIRLITKKVSSFWLVVWHIIVEYEGNACMTLPELKKR